MEKKSRNIIWWLELIIKLGLLTVGFLEASSLTFGKPIVSLFLWPTVFGGGLLMLIRLVHWKSYWRSKNFFMLVAFCVSYLVSIVVNIRYGWYTNIRTLIWCAFLFFLVYCYCTDEKDQVSQKQFTILTIYYVIVNATLSLLSFAFMISGYSQTFYGEGVGPIYYIGFNWGRLYGAYWDANIGAVMSCVGIILAVSYFLKNHTAWVRVLLALNVILEVAYIAFSDSRTGQLCLCVATVSYVFLAVKRRKNIQKAILYALIGLAVAFVFPVGIKKAYNAITTTSKEQIEQTVEVPETQAVTIDLNDSNEAEGETAAFFENKSSETESESTEAIDWEAQRYEEQLAQSLGRADEYSEDVTNRRADIWKSAIEIFRTSPIVGISHNNVLPYVTENLPDSYLITNDHMKFESMHNVFFDILVGQGAVGLLIYLAMAFTFFITIIKNWKVIVDRMGFMGIGCFVILLVMVTSTFVMTEIVYVTSPMATVFWMSMSYLMQAATKNPVSADTNNQ